MSHIGPKIRAMMIVIAAAYEIRVAAAAVTVLDKYMTLPVFFHCCQDCHPFGTNRYDGKRKKAKKTKLFNIEIL
ncbi:MAG: hypothetical protein K1X28_02945 [Parachlamydiales bacterium]|nr:hypothetical protein [Parachlamydiales bacterium]